MKISLPKLPKLPKLDALTGLFDRFRKGGKKRSKVLDDDIVEEDFLPSSERGDDTDDDAPDPKDTKKDDENDGDEDSEEDDDDEYYDDDEEDAKRKRLIMIGGGAAAAVLLLAGGLWWGLSGSGGDDLAERAAPVVVADLERLEAETAALDMATGGETPPPSSGAPGGEPTQSPGAGQDAGSLNQMAGNENADPDAGVVVPATTRQAFAGIETSATPSSALDPAPDGTLVEETDIGLIPKIAEDGRTAFEAYARPFDDKGGKNAKIAIMVTGLGHSRAATEAAITLLPAEVSLVFDSYARGIGYWIERAREAGHEVLLSLPMESATFPFEDPGPGALDVLSAPQENINQMEWVMARGSGYIGMMSSAGSAFTKSEEQMKVVMTTLKERGLAYVDGGFAHGSLGPRLAHEIKTPWAAVDIELDGFLNSATIDIKLDEFEGMAKRRAVAVARIAPYPVSMERLSAWLGKLDEMELTLVPISALANKQLVR